jgi:hypothetical protein
MMVDMSSPVVEQMNKTYNATCDINLIKDSMAFALMGITGLIDNSPENETFLLNGANAYFAYTFAFVEEMDPLRTKAMYFVARNYGLRALFKKDYQTIIDKPFPEFEEIVKKIGKKDVPALFWATISWLSYIRYNLGDMHSYVEIPKAEAMAYRLLELDETYYFGTPHSVLACYIASLPEISGGDPAKAKMHFEKAIEISKGKFIMHELFYARFYAVRVQDKDLFVKLVTDVKNAPDDILPGQCAMTTLCRMKAEKLLNNVNSFF